MINALRVYLSVGMMVAISAVTVFANLAFTKPLKAANINSLRNNKVVIEGEIRKGDFNRFIRLVKAGQGRVGTVYLFSQGGDFF